MQIVANTVVLQCKQKKLTSEKCNCISLSACHTFQKSVLPTQHFWRENLNFEFYSLTQILREINSDEFMDSKVDILTDLGAFTIFVKTW